MHLKWSPLTTFPSLKVCFELFLAAKPHEQQYFILSLEIKPREFRRKRYIAQYSLTFYFTYQFWKKLPATRVSGHVPYRQMLSTHMHMSGRALSSYFSIGHQPLTSGSQNTKTFIVTK